MTQEGGHLQTTNRIRARPIHAPCALCLTPALRSATRPPSLDFNMTDLWRSAENYRIEHRLSKIGGNDITPPLQISGITERACTHRGPLILPQMGRAVRGSSPVVGPPAAGTDPGGVADAPPGGGAEPY